MVIPDFDPREAMTPPNAVSGWSRHDFSFNLFTLTRSRLEKKMVDWRGRFEISVAVIGLIIAVCFSAFLPGSRLPDIASIVTLFAVGMTEYWIMRVNARMVHEYARINLERKAMKAIKMSDEEYEKGKHEGTITLNETTFYCVGEPRD